jgi:hypothetical protein
MTNHPVALLTRKGPVFIRVAVTVVIDAIADLLRGLKRDTLGELTLNTAALTEPTFALTDLRRDALIDPTVTVIVQEVALLLSHPLDDLGEGLAQLI